MSELVSLLRGWRKILVMCETFRPNYSADRHPPPLSLSLTHTLSLCLHLSFEFYFSPLDARERDWEPPVWQRIKTRLFSADSRRKKSTGQPESWRIFIGVNEQSDTPPRSTVIPVDSWFYEDDETLLEIQRNRDRQAIGNDRNLGYVKPLPSFLTCSVIHRCLCPLSVSAYLLFCTIQRNNNTKLHCVGTQHPLDCPDGQVNLAGNMWRINLSAASLWICKEYESFMIHITLILIDNENKEWAKFTQNNISPDEKVWVWLRTKLNNADVCVTLFRCFIYKEEERRKGKIRASRWNL